MNILMFSWEFPPNISGGLGVACFGLSRAISEIQPGISVTVVMPETMGNEDRRFVNVMGINEVLNGSRESGPFIDTNRDSSYSSNHKARARQFAQLVSENSGFFERFDLVHAHDWLTFEAGLIVKAVSGKPLVAHVHSTEWDRAGESGDAEIIEIERRGMDGADRIIAVSELTREILMERYGQDPAKIEVVYNGSETGPRFDRRGDRLGNKRVCFIGRITRQKSPECFIRAAHQVLQRRHDVEFVMAGDGDLREMMMRMTCALGVDGAVAFPGFLTRGEILGLLENSDVYVMPSISEPFGIGALEAINAGVPVILSRRAGITEVIRSAPKIDWWNVDAQVKLILNFLDYPERAQRSASRCAREAARLSWVNAAEGVLLQYKALVGK